MNDLDRKTKWRWQSLSERESPYWAIVLGVGGLLTVGGGFYRIWLSQSVSQPQSIAIAAKPAIEMVSALGRLEPEGEVIRVFAPTSFEGARVEALKVSHGRSIRQGEIVAVLDTYARRQSAVRSAQEELEVARSKLTQVKAGAKQGEIQAQQATIGRFQAERDTQTGAQQATVARVIAETSTQTASQQATVARVIAETATQIDAQKATIAESQAELENAQLEYKRYETLYQQGVVTASIRDSKRLNAQTAQQKVNRDRANLNRITASGKQQIAEASANLRRIQTSGQQQINEAKANLRKIETSMQQQVKESQFTLNKIAEVRPVDIKVARSQVAQAQANVAQAQANLDAATVRSPQAGKVLKIHTRAGERVGNDGIISLGQTDRMVAVAEVYELDIGRIRSGQNATVTSKNNAFPEVLRGKVVEVGLEINKQDVLNTDPAAKFDARVVEVKVLLDEASSRRVAGLTNLSIQVAIDVKS
ncbi:HlyD family efflux transporter periplasmic adaptor subunit [Chamaesiphon sp. OTE_20_metabat_361]|uniref:HlyD family efflux transporter periplasmic adaptor subunit n=1 Tax=Chamaesiphon sp. OTE_20_metabat_361 TaxID=2964689 RepID=UPI00286A2421|nr:HlyD family efflux transporter periplasmic adaptor subunit [Chamaesiphon sp. OTE_20_metabat_361]